MRSPLPCWSSLPSKPGVGGGNIGGKVHVGSGTEFKSSVYFFTFLVMSLTTVNSCQCKERGVLCWLSPWCVGGDDCHSGGPSHCPQYADHHRSSGYVCIGVFVCVCVCVCMCVCVCVFVCMYVCAHVYVHMCMSVLWEGEASHARPLLSCGWFWCKHCNSNYKCMCVYWLITSSDLPILHHIF